MYNSGRKIDYDAIGKGFVNLLDEEEQAILKIGMIPLKKYEILLDKFFLNICRNLSENETGAFYGLAPERLVKCLRDDFKRDCEKQITNAIYKHGDLVV
jgi:hypothetical protein